MKNIFFFDIDNTLLDHRTHAIPDSALQAIARLKDDGHTVVVATGRSYGHAEPYVRQIDPDYAITQNGARILEAGAAVLEIPLARAPLVALFDWITAQGQAFGVNHGETGYVSRPLPEVIAPLASVAMAAQSDDPFYLREDAYQAWLFFDEALDATLLPEMLHRFPEFAVVRWHRNAIDVMPRGVNKWTGCQWVMARAGFGAAQAIAFGDGLNDLEMLKGVGLGVAMDNGHPELKAVAQRIAPALHLDGVARMLGELAANGHFAASLKS